MGEDETDDRSRMAGPIETEAADWAARSLGRALSKDEHGQLDAWLAQDRRNLGAYMRAQAVLSQFDGLAVADAAAPVASPRVPASGRSAAHWSRRGLFGTGLAASLALVSGLWVMERPESYQAARGEVRIIALPDGSAATLDALSQLEVRFTEEERGLTLVEGRALFRVQPNSVRPFTVRAGDVQVMAVGTSFSVEHSAGSVRIVMEEGLTEVRQGSDSYRLRAGDRLDMGAHLPRMHRQSERERSDAFAWRDGVLVLDSVTLGEAAGLFARYGTYRLEIVPEVAGLKVTGRFATNDPAGFAEAAALSLGIRADIGEQGARLEN